jgi:uncharacterized protein YybS (DUF2232 family)
VGKVVKVQPGPLPARADARVPGLLVAGTASALLFGAPAVLPPAAPLALMAPLPLAIHRLMRGPLSAWLAAALAAALVAAAAPIVAGFAYLFAFALPGLLMAEALARGRGLLRGCVWAFGPLALLVAGGLLLSPAALSDRVLEPIEQLRSEAMRKELSDSGMSAERVQEFTEQVGVMHDALSVVYPAFLLIAAFMMVAANAAMLRLYLLRRDPGWLEDGEFERVRFPLALVLAFVLAGASVALPLARPAAYNVLLVVAFCFGLQGLAVVGFYARRLAAPPLVRGLLLLLVLVNPWAPQLLALLGLFDNWFDFRKYAEPPAEKPSAPGPLD